MGIDLNITVRGGSQTSVSMDLNKIVRDGEPTMFAN